MEDMALLPTRRWQKSLVYIILSVIAFYAFRNFTKTRLLSFRTDTSITVPSIKYVPKSKSASGSTSNQIPKIIHQTWKGPDVPLLFESWMRSWIDRNPDWQYWFWTDEDILLLIQNRYPNLLPLYESYPSGGYRADVFRYVALYEFGGFYADIDAECLQPLDGVLRKYNCVIGQEPLEHAHFLGPMGIPLVSNAVMACHPRHKFFKNVIDDLNSYAGTFSWKSILYATGPYMLTEKYKGYIPGLTEEDEDFISLSKPVEFLPTIDNSMLDRMREVCIHSDGKEFLSDKYFDNQAKFCTRITSFGFDNKPDPKESFTDHHWTHTWATKIHDPWGVKNSDRTFNAKDIIPRIR